MSEAYFDKPKVIGTVNPAHLKALHDFLPETDTYVSWGKQPDNEARRQLLDHLRPLHERLMTLWGKRPNNVYYSIDTRTVDPNRSQRGLPWHPDPGEVITALSVSDVTPTEYLYVHDKEKFEHYKDLLRERIKKEKIHELREDMIATYGLAIYSPKPFEVVAMTKQIHRSSRNTSGKALPRTWVRARLGTKYA